MPQSLTDVLPRETASEFVQSASVHGVFNYASAVLNDGLMLLEFKDAICEGDGPRIICCWKVFLLYFQYANHKDYRIEAFRLLADINASASPRIAHQLLWSGGVNVHGGKGNNVPLDLHMEHLNRIIKDHVANLGPNVARKSIIQCSKSLSGIMKVLENVDTQLEVKPPSTRHSRASITYIHARTHIAVPASMNAVLPSTATDLMDIYRQMTR